MSFKFLCMFLVLSIDITWAQLPGSRCDQLPKTAFDVKAVNNFNPLIYHYTLDSTFECAHQITLGPLKNKRGYDGTIFILKDSTLVTFDFTVSTDNLSVDLTNCNSGERITYHAINGNFSPTGGWHCVYACARDGIAVEKFACMATDASFFKQETEAVALTRGVPNWDNIRDARLSCTAPKFCHILP